MVAPADNLAVHCRSVVKLYGRGESAVRALRGVDLDIHQGELFMLIGPSGCGKTTLISVVAGILDATSGTVQVLGEDLMRLRGMARTRFRGRNVGFVFQQFNLLPALTAAENVAIPLMLNGVGRAAAVRRGRELLGRVGLADRQGALPAQLSGGQQQRVAIARALVHEPRLIVCDEPTSALDHQTGHRVMELMREVAVGPDRTLVIVTHDARIFEFADRIARMDDGHIERVVSDPKELEAVQAAPPSPESVGARPAPASDRRAPTTLSQPQRP